MLVGFASGGLGLLLKLLVHYLHQGMTFSHHPGTAALRFLFPLAGILLSVALTRRFWQGRLEAGVGRILADISVRRGVVPAHKMVSTPVTAALTVGLGGSAGLEAPIVVAGASIGSRFAVSLHLSSRERLTLLACGAAAGISAVFNAPIAGVLFAVEVLLQGVVLVEVVPILLASAVGILLARLTTADEILIFFRNQQAFQPKNVPFYILLGASCGFMAWAYAKIFTAIERRTRDFALDWPRILVAGLLLGLLCALFPPLLGEGFATLRTLADGSMVEFRNQAIFLRVLPDFWEMMAVGLLLLFLKPVAAALTVGSGGNGGNFAPSLFVGALLGFLFSSLLRHAFGWDVPVGNFTMVGMAGLLSGVMYAPLTAIFLIAEGTGGYALFIPLMIVSGIAFSIVKGLNPHSMERRSLVAKGQAFGDDLDVNILSQIDVDARTMKVSLFPAPPADRREWLERVESSPTRGVLLFRMDEGAGFHLPQDFPEGEELPSPRRLAEVPDREAGLDAWLAWMDRNGLSIGPVRRGDEFLGVLEVEQVLRAYREIVQHKRI